MTNHDNDILILRDVADGLEREIAETNSIKKQVATTTVMLALRVSADLLEVHDATGISLDNWHNPRALVEHLLGHPMTENRV